MNNLSTLYRILLIAAAVVAAALLLWLYAFADPAGSPLFPRCPFLSLTGLKCPGCGTQRALHQLLTGHFTAAWHYNPALIVSIPVIGVLYGAWLCRRRYPRFYMAVNSSSVILTIFLLFVVWTVVRNIFGW